MDTATAEIEVDDLLNRIRQTMKEAEKVSIFWPPSCYSGVKCITRQMVLLEPSYDKYIKTYNYDFVQDPIVVGMQSAMMSQEKIKRLGVVLSYSMNLQSSWSLLGATRERKAAFGLSMVALYVSLVSLAVSAISMLRC